MPTADDKKRIKLERSYLHNWLLKEENRKSIIEQHCDYKSVEKSSFWAEVPIGNVSCNFKIWCLLDTQQQQPRQYYILIKFKYTKGEEDFIDAMRSLKRQITLQTHDNNQSYERNHRTVRGTILTLDEDDLNDLVLTKQGIPIIRILEPVAAK